MSEKFPNMDYDADEVINDFKAKFKWPKNDDVDVVVKPPKVGIKLLLSALITLVIGGGIYYMMLPAFNIHDTEMYAFIICIIAVFMGVFALLCKANKLIERREYVKKKSLIPLIIVVALVVVMGIGWLCGATLFRAKSYSEIMQITNSTFSDDFESISYNKVPRIDETRAVNLADQQLGTLEEYKSQYVVANTTTLINYKGNPVRVAYLQYGDVFKWFSNTKEGLPAYMIVDLITQKVTVVNCKEKFGNCIQYSPSELFNEKLIRHIRFQYPTALLDTPNFEINDDGYPYWITPVLNKTIGLFGGTDVKGIVITDALNGESQYYDIDTVRSDASLSWIDVVYNADLVLEQYNYNGKLSGGFWNSLIFQKNVSLASAGNGYIAMQDDVWVYTGVTSPESDSSNFGFILCNQRTKETRYYANGGAIETAAKSSAEDAVQNYKYTATFPILLDIDGHPTYFMSFYGDGNTVKGYALVSLEDKTIVGTGLLDNLKSDEKALNAAVENYIEALQDKGIVDESVKAEDFLVDEDKVDDTKTNDPSVTESESQPAEENDGTVTGKVDSVKSSVNNGNTVYYFEVNGKYYYIAVTDCMQALLISAGDEVTITVGNEENGEFVSAQNIEKIK